MRKKLSNIFLGLVFLVIGIGYAGDAVNLWDFSLFFRGWWTLFIIIPCLVSIINNGINVGSFTGLIIGLMLLAAHYVNIRINFWGLIIPVIFIAIGLKIIFQSFQRKTINVEPTIHVEGQAGNYGPGRAEYSAIFSGNSIKVTDRFTGADLNAIFGGLTLDLRDAVIDSNVEITATTVFGGIDIYVPSGVQIKVNNVPVFGGVSIKNRHSYDSGAYTIYLNSTTMFGGIDIK